MCSLEVRLNQADKMTDTRNLEEAHEGLETASKHDQDAGLQIVHDRVESVENMAQQMAKITEAVLGDMVDLADKELPIREPSFFDPTESIVGGKEKNP